MNLSTATGITVAECLPAGQPIDINPGAVAAFLGQADTGPINQAITVTSINQFRKLFGGGDWPLSRAASQYFTCGGSELVVVRIANGARAAQLEIPAGDTSLTLRAVNPGRCESIRAAIDFDNIPADKRSTRFNLTLQRLVGEHSRIVDQEIFPGASMREDSPDNLREILSESGIAEVAGPLPSAVPKSFGHRSYAGIAEAGTDGDPISVYDLIGSKAEGTGIFALEDLTQLDLLYVPELDRVKGAAVLFEAAALAYVGSRHAMLIVDPPEKSGPLQIRPDSPSLLSYSTRPVRRQRPDESVCIGAMLIGLLEQATRTGQPGAGIEHIKGSLGRGLVLPDSRNTQKASRLSRAITLDIGERSDGRFVFREQGGARRLSAQRLRLAVQRAVRESTKWLVFSDAGPAVWHELEKQVGNYLATLSDRGYIEADDRALPWFVRCDSLTNSRADGTRRENRFLFGYCARGTTEMDVFSVCQSLSGAELSEAAFCPVFSRPA